MNNYRTTHPAIRKNTSRARKIAAGECLDCERLAAAGRRRCHVCLDKNRRSRSKQLRK